VKTTGIVRGGLLRGRHLEGAAARDDHVYLAADKLGGQFGQTIVPALRPAVFDRDVLPIDIAGFAQATPQCGERRRPRAERLTVEKTDDGQRRRLRESGLQPQAGGQDERPVQQIATSHGPPVLLSVPLRHVRVD
jgi:hypothetical protein